MIGWSAGVVYRSCMPRDLLGFMTDLGKLRKELVLLSYPWKSDTCIENVVACKC